MNKSNHEKHVVKFENVSLTYPNGFRGLTNINTTIDKGDFVSIIGLSGAGKTTMLKTINKVNVITEGKLIVKNKNISKLTGRALKTLRKKIGLIFQGYNLVENATVMQNLLSALSISLPWYRRLFGIYNKREKVHILNELEKVGLLDKAYVRVSSLSGGQKQRVALAKVISQLPSIILADEPVAALDPVMSKEIMDIFFKLNREMKYTIFANLHHVDMAIKYSTRIIGIKKGQIVYDGPAHKITEKNLKDIYGDELSNEAIDLEAAIRANRELDKKGVK